MGEGGAATAALISQGFTEPRPSGSGLCQSGIPKPVKHPRPGACPTLRCYAAIMAPPAKRAFLRIALVAALAAVLVLLAVLQYRWSLEISRAERTRIEASLNTSVNQFRQEFYRELMQVSTAFHSDPTAEPDDFWSSYAERYQAWTRTATRPDLVANVFVWPAGAAATSSGGRRVRTG